MTEKEKYLNTYKMWTAYQPAFTSWNGALYESDLIRSAIAAKARNVSKLKLDIYGSAQSTLKTALKRRPNPLQTWSQFFSKASTIIDMENTCFIMPFFDKNAVIGHIVVPPTQCQLTLVENNIMLVYQPNTGGQPLAAEFADCGIMTQHQYKSDLFGSDNKPLHDTMELLNLQRQGIAEAVKNSAVYRFMAKYTEAAFSDDLKDERVRFTEDNLAQDDENDGLLLFPNTYNDIKQVESKQYVLDDKQVQQIKENVFNYFGVNEKVLRNEVVDEEWRAYYEGAIEPFAIQFSEVYEQMLFTDLELANGNGVMLATNRLEHMPEDLKITKAHDAVDRGLLSINEARRIAWGLEGREGGDVYAIRGEYKNSLDMEDNNEIN